MEVVSAAESPSSSTDVSTKTSLLSTAIKEGCVPAFASQDLQKMTLLSMEMGNGEEVVFQVGWVAATDRAKRLFDKMTSVLSCDKCGQKTAEEEIVQYGLCDHHICHECLSTDKEMYPGVVYCSHQDCLEHVPQDLPLVSSTSSCSVSSLPIVTMALVKIFLFNNSNRPSQWQMEVKGSTPVSQIVDWVHWQVDCDVSKHNVFFSDRKEVHRRHLKLVKNKEERIARLHPEHVNLVLVAPGISMGGCF